MDDEHKTPGCSTPKKKKKMLIKIMVLRVFYENLNEVNL